MPAYQMYYRGIAHVAREYNIYVRMYGAIYISRIFVIYSKIHCTYLRDRFFTGNYIKKLTWWFQRYNVRDSRWHP